MARINEKTLIINLIKTPKNNYSVQLNKTFMPTHFIQNDAYIPVCGQLEPVIRTIRFFEQKYGVLIHNKDSIINIITITEVEQIGNRLIKVFRPCIFYTDLN